MVVLAYGTGNGGNTKIKTALENETWRTEIFLIAFGITKVNIWEKNWNVRVHIATNWNWTMEILRQRNKFMIRTHLTVSHFGWQWRRCAFRRTDAVVAQQRVASVDGVQHLVQVGKSAADIVVLRRKPRSSDPRLLGQRWRWTRAVAKQGEIWLSCRVVGRWAILRGDHCPFWRGHGVTGETRRLTAVRNTSWAAALLRNVARTEK